ncbi:hypothetical protein NEIMUCOT_05286 [Neisseria mucosa ATCC 25996]|uniref:Uncharacterized protein n=1 Tax=Neisseria mucosa (strain ATCC 25996 / DSM 4631 / NCTC 10774 / M26) TaxID=546266 RepID=D2ZXD6_NEIM2|nr:hypothetical protein NEIMUCOT_05286 [Neisseria mucosa ATCC 25996]
MKGRLKIVWTEFTLSVFRRPFQFQSAMKKRQSDGHHLSSSPIIHPRRDKNHRSF